MYIPLVIFHYNMYTAYWAPMPIHCINDDGLKIYSESPWPLPSSFVKIRVVLLKAFADPSINHESQGLLQAKKLTKTIDHEFQTNTWSAHEMSKGPYGGQTQWYDVIWCDIYMDGQYLEWFVSNLGGHDTIFNVSTTCRRLLVKTSWHSPFWGTVLIKPCQRSMWCFRCLYPC